MKNSYKQGITLLEIIMVLAITAILVAVVAPQFSSMRENQVIKNAVADVMSTLSRARSSTLASIDSSEYGVHFQSDRVIIFKGKVFSSGAGDNETINITSPATISTITFPGGGADVYFNRLSGTPNITGSIVISTTNFTKTITIYATGVASVN